MHDALFPHRQAKGETPVPWDEWCEQKKAIDAFFPGTNKVKRYTLISKYPKAYEKGMSIDQAWILPAPCQHLAEPK